MVQPRTHITLHSGVRAVRIHRFAKCVLGADGTTEPYDKLIIATGSRPYIPPVEGLKREDGSDKPGIFGFRSLEDCRRIAEYARGRRRAAVIGGGLLGLECAHALQAMGMEAHVIHRSKHLMNQQLDSSAGAILQSLLEKLGINVHLGKNTTGVLGEECVTGLAFKEGPELECDIVVFASGTTPNTELAARCGLTVERAIVVDNQLRTDDPRIYAVGECVQYRAQVYGLVAPAWEQAKVLAEHITGHDLKAAYHGSKIATRLKVAGVQLASMGKTEPGEEQDEVVQFAEPRKGTYKKLIIRDGRLIGGILLGDAGRAAELLSTFDSSARAPRRAHQPAVQYRRAGRDGRIRSDSAGHSDLQLQQHSHGRAAGLRQEWPAHRRGGDGSNVAPAKPVAPASRLCATSSAWACGEATAGLPQSCRARMASISFSKNTAPPCRRWRSTSTAC